MSAQATWTTDIAMRRLEALSTELQDRGWIAHLRITPDRVPSLFVQNPAAEAAALSDHVCAAPRGDAWMFWWSWAEPIAETESDAADIIVRALRLTRALDQS